jgi:hypothetical protein
MVISKTRRTVEELREADKCAKYSGTIVSTFDRYTKEELEEIISRYSSK